jgi:hypothetical protein
MHCWCGSSSAPHARVADRAHPTGSNLYHYITTTTLRFALHYIPAAGFSIAAKSHPSHLAIQNPAPSFHICTVAIHSAKITFHHINSFSNV